MTRRHGMRGWIFCSEASWCPDVATPACASLPGRHLSCRSVRRSWEAACVRLTPVPRHVSRRPHHEFLRCFGVSSCGDLESRSPDSQISGARARTTEGGRSG